MNRLLLFLLLIFGAHLAGGQPTASFTATPRTGCAPMVVSFTSTSSGNPTSYSWTFGNGATSTAQNPVIAYTTPGTFSVSLTVSNASGSNTSTQTGFVTVYQVPTVGLSATPLVVCPGAPVSFSSIVTWNAAGSGMYTWDFGDGSSSSLANPTHSYTNGGLYTIKLTGTNSVGCPRTDTQFNLIRVHPRPSASFTASDTAVCNPTGSTTFTAVSGTGTGPFSYVWDFGDGGSPGSGNPVTHSYSALGMYTVKLYITDGNGCKDSLTRTNYIRRRSIATGFSAAASACVGTSVTATNTTGSTTGTMSWDFGDGSSPITGTTASHSYTAAGSYNIIQTVREGGCVQTASQRVTINAQPDAGFTYTPAHPCPAPVQLQFNALATGPGHTYSWNFGTGLTGTGSSPLHWYLKDWLYKVTLGVTNSSGCSATSTRWIAVHPLVPDASALPNSGCLPLRVNFTMKLDSRDTLGMSMPYPHGIASVSWNFGDGSSGTGALAAHTYTTVGRYQAVATCVTMNGCTIMDTIEVRVGTRPTANFGAQPRNVCVRTPVFFIDSSIGATIPVNEWDYDFGDGVHSIGASPVHRYAKPGIYTVQLAAGINGCFDTISKVNYIVVNDPQARMEVRTSCTTPLQVQFSDSSIGATHHVWYFGDGSSSTASHPTHTYASPGNYTAMLTVFNSNTGCSDTLWWPLNLNPLAITLTADRTQLCRNETVKLTATTSGGGVPKSYAWWLGTGASPAFGNALPNSTSDILLPTAGLFNAAVEIIDQNGCAWRAQRNGYILVGGPRVSFSASPPFACLPNGNVTFTDNSTHPTGLSGASRTWDFGDGSPPVTLTGSTATHTYSTTGSYGIILKVTDNIGCTDSGKVQNFLNVSDPSSVWGTTSTRACENAPFYFFNSSTGTSLTYQWNFGDGATSTQPSPMHVYRTLGTYTVRLIVTDGIGCKDTLTRPSYITVNAKPQAGFDLSDTMKVCPPLIINFTDRSAGGVRWNYAFGTGATSTLQHPSHTYTVPRIYTIRQIATNAAGCHDTAFRTARLLGYAGVLSYTPLTGCAPLTVNFRANDVDHVPGFVYNFGDGSTGATTGKTISHTYTRAGSFVPSITLTDNLGCTSTSVGLDTIKVDGVISGFTFSPFPACDRGTIQFLDTSRGAFGPINPPSWRFHDGTTSAARNPTKTYAGPGTYSVILYNSTASGCRDTLRSQVVFHPLPVIDGGRDTTICRGDSAMLKPRGGVSYAWSPAGSLSCDNCTNPMAAPVVQTRYTVTGTDTNGCTNTDTVLVRIRVKVDATAGPDTEICSGTTTSLTVTGGATYTWSPSITLHNPTSATPIAYPMSTVRYMVVSRLASCIPDTDYVNVVVHQTPDVDAGASRVIIAGESTQLEGVGSGPIAYWEWTPPEGLNCTNCYDPLASPKRSTLYMARVTSEAGCTSTDTVRVTVLCDQSQVFIPNTFTPEGNGVNDVFYPRGKGIERIGRFRIYNRWGELVFERLNMMVDDRSQGWDGRKDGRLLSPDVYVYTVEATCDTGEPIKWQGDVMLLR